jgi:hypothetical protein
MLTSSISETRALMPPQEDGVTFLLRTLHPMGHQQSANGAPHGVLTESIRWLVRSLANCSVEPSSPKHIPCSVPYSEPSVLILSFHCQIDFFKWVYPQQLNRTRFFSSLYVHHIQLVVYFIWLELQWQRGMVARLLYFCFLILYI